MVPDIVHNNGEKHADVTTSNHTKFTVVNVNECFICTIIGKMEGERGQ